MRDFIYLLKRVYATCALLAIATALVGVPIWLAIEYTPLWSAAEIITAPVGLALLMWGAIKIDEW